MLPLVPAPSKRSHRPRLPFLRHFLGAAPPPPSALPPRPAALRTVQELFLGRPTSAMTTGSIEGVIHGLPGRTITAEGVKGTSAPPPGTARMARAIEPDGVTASGGTRGKTGTSERIVMGLTSSLSQKRTGKRRCWHVIRDRRAELLHVSRNPKARSIKRSSVDTPCLTGILLRPIERDRAPPPLPT